MANSFPLATFNPRSSRAGAGGPKTAAGKARSAVNAVKHGLTSTNPVVLEFETLEAWEAYRDAFVSDLHPVGQVEAELALELALIQWRRRRVAAYEARAIDSRLQAVEASLEYYAERGETPEELEARAAAALNDALLPDLEAVQRLLRYEATSTASSTTRSANWSASRRPAGTSYKRITKRTRSLPSLPPSPRSLPIPVRRPQPSGQQKTTKPTRSLPPSPRSLPVINPSHSLPPLPVAPHQTVDDGYSTSEQAN